LLRNFCHCFNVGTMFFSVYSQLVTRVGEMFCCCFKTLPMTSFASSILI
jgi:hypothetical protein